MPINAITNPAPATPSGPTGTPNLGTQQFLQLLVAQLQNQDPMQPMDNTQFVTQLAQFSSLQTLQQIQTSLDSSVGAQLLGEAMTLLGHTVTAQPPGAAPVTATVQGVKISGSDVLLDLGSSTVSLSDVQEVKATQTQK